MNPRVRAAILACLMGQAEVAMAQQPAGAARFDGTCSLSGDQYTSLISSYEAGDWMAVQTNGATLLKECTLIRRVGNKDEQVKFNLAVDYVGVVLLGYGLDGGRQEVAFLLHSPHPEPYRMTLPGLRDQPSVAGRFYELFVAPPKADPANEDYRFNSRYVVERVADPISAKAGAFLKTALDIGKIRGARGARQPRADLPATCFRVALPFERAVITAEHLVTGPDVVDDEEKPLKTTQKYQNTPLRRWTFGLLTGALTGSRANDRAKVESNLLSSDPLPTTLSMAIVNIHPRPYDEGLPSMTGDERFRFFTGTVLTPGFGVGAGLGFGIVRGFGVNAGGAVFLTRRLRSGDTFGQAPSNADSPTRLGIGSALFVGFSYAFE